MIEAELPEQDIFEGVETPFELQVLFDQKKSSMPGDRVHNDNRIQRSVMEAGDRINRLVEAEVSKQDPNKLHLSSRAEIRAKLYERLAAKERKAQTLEEQLKLAKESLNFYRSSSSRNVLQTDTNQGIYANKRLASAQESFINANKPQNPSKFISTLKKMATGNYK
jgi:hypothetical protein